MICRKRRLIFVHIPKCGGSSVEDVIWPDIDARSTKDLWMGFVRPHFNKYQTGGLQHLTANHIRREVGDAIYDECFTFTVCRDPLRRLFSQYKYIAQRRDLREFAEIPDDYDFSSYLDQIRQHMHVQWMPQTHFFMDRTRSVMVDKVYFLESISKDPSMFFHDVKISSDCLPKKNAAGDVEDPYISSEDRIKIFEMYESDYEYFRGIYDPPISSSAF